MYDAAVVFVCESHILLSFLFLKVFLIDFWYFSPDKKEGWWLCGKMFLDGQNNIVLLDV